MARCEIPYVVYKGQNPVQVASGASVLVNIRGGGAATIYAAEVGATTGANPITTDAFGRIEGWVDEGSYDLIVSGSGITTYTQPVELNRGDGVSRYAVGSIPQAALANGAVSFAKLGTDVFATIMPTGSVLPYAGTTAPSTAWSLCDGGALDGTVAINTPLWTLIGTTYGGTGQANFFKPDLRGRTILGPDTMATPAGAANRLTSNGLRGNSGGAEAVTLLLSQTPQHNHGVIDGGHAHNIYAPYQGVQGDAGYNIPRFPSGGSLGPATGNLNTDTRATGISIASSGGGGSHPNLPPYQVLNWIIKL